MVFQGLFYGDRVSGIRAGDSLAEGLPDSAFMMLPFFRKRFARMMGYEMNGYRITRIPLAAKVGADSSFTVTGELHPDWGFYWGLATFPEPRDMRHVLTASSKREDRKKVLYLIAPIQAFDSLKRVRISAHATNAEFVSISPGMRWDEAPKAAFDTAWTSDIPEAVTLNFRVPGKVRPSLWGGPMAFAGSHRGGYAVEAGWEFQLPIRKDWAALPSLDWQQTRKQGGFPNVGLRGAWFGCLSAGLQWRPISGDWIPVAGLNFVSFGMEARAFGGGLEGILFHLTL